MSPLRRGPDKTSDDVRAFLEETFPGAAPHTWLHVMICWVYRAPLFEGRTRRKDVVARAAERGITGPKFRQIVSGDLSGIKWSALEAVLVACGASDADITVAQELFDRTQPTSAALIQADGPLGWIEDPAGDWTPLPRGHWRGTAGRAGDDPPAPRPPVTGSLSDARRPHPAAGIASTPATAAPPPGPGAPPAPCPAVPGSAPNTAEDAAEAPAVPAQGADAPARCGGNVPGCIAADGHAAPARTVPDAPAATPRPVLEPEPEPPAPTELQEEPPPPAAQHAAAKVFDPDPRTAADPAAFVALMKEYRQFKNKTLREMEKQCARHPRVKETYSYSSFSIIGQNGKLPKRALVLAYIAGCGGSDAEINLWLLAHRRLSVQPPPAD